MTASLDSTHDPALQSWVESANEATTDFPIQNLPFGRFRQREQRGAGPWRIGVAIGDQVLDLRAAGIIDTDDMVSLLAAPAAERRAMRRLVSEGLRLGSGRETVWRQALTAVADVVLGLPCDIRNYTDFYTGIHHARAIGRLFRPDQPLLPNYQWVPIGYHGRASSLLASGANFRRPHGQIKPADRDAPVLSPTARLDFELELGFIVGQGNDLGQPVNVEAAEERIFGVTLLNDWSARDIQSWEYQPLGPFLSKNFASTLSPWMVTLEALAPFRLPFTRPAGDPAPLSYLDCAADHEAGSIDIRLQAWIETETMRRAGMPPELLSESNASHAYWTMAQLVAHHTVNGCNLQTGDLLGSGTLSGPAPDEGGSLIELTAGGKNPVLLHNGEVRTFLLDGDAIIFKAICEKPGARRIGFGECRGTVGRVPQAFAAAGYSHDR